RSNCLAVGNEAYGVLAGRQRGRCKTPLRVDLDFTGKTRVLAFDDDCVAAIGRAEDAARRVRLSVRGGRHREQQCRDERHESIALLTRTMSYHAPSQIKSILGFGQLSGTT